MADPAEQRTIICIPGPWESRTEFVRAIVESSGGSFLFAARMLFDPASKDHADLDFCDTDESVSRAFQIGGRGRLSRETVQRTSEHRSVAYLHFPLDLQAQRLRILKFTRAVLAAGGMAIKVQSSGAAHEGDRWVALLESGDLFDLYSASVVLVGDDSHYYSCGMHHFSLPECQVATALATNTAADTINGFNFYQIAEQPELSSGDTFSLTADAPTYRLTLLPDHRHAVTHLFHNRNGLWNLVEIAGR